MFSKFKELFSSENLLEAAYTTTVKMLEFDHKMYETARSVLRDTDGSDMPMDIKKADQKINKFEREVRRNVLTHLAVAGTQNLAAGLALVTIVISVERIGDYTKNIVGLAKDHQSMLKGGPVEAELAELEAAIANHFPMALEVLNTQDKKLGRKIMGEQDKVSKTADHLASTMVRAKNLKLNTSDAVCLAMYSRYLKRVNSHLTTIASSIVNPFTRIGFREKSKPTK